MSLNLNVEATDKDLEDLLVYLDGLKHLGVFDVMGLLDVARTWVGRAQDGNYVNASRARVHLTTASGRELFAHFRDIEERIRPAARSDGLASRIPQASKEQQSDESHP